MHTAGKIPNSKDDSMDLPVIQDVPRAPGPGDLLRLYLQTEVRWCEHLAEPAQLDVGSAFANSALVGLADANQMLDAVLPAGMAPAQAVELVERHYASAGTRCWRWTMNVSAPAEQTQRLVDHLLAQGYARHSAVVMRLSRPPARPLVPVKGLTVIPARASYRHVEAIARESAARWNVPGLVEAAMLHLDDPHFDAILALREGRAVAYGGVLAVGEMGRIDQVFVSEAHRRQGIGRTMVGRLCEICARSQFRHVLLSAEAHDRAALSLYEAMGFATVGSIESFCPPDAVRATAA